MILCCGIYGITQQRKMNTKYFVLYILFVSQVSCTSSKIEADVNINSFKPIAILQLDESDILVSEVIGNIDEPWDITWGPDQHLWFTEHKGFVSRLNPRTGKRKVILKIPEVHYNGSRGLLSMVFHPDFKNEPYVYLHYTVLDPWIMGGENIKSKLVRYKYDSLLDTLIDSETILSNIPGKSYHNGSRMIISSDNKIILSTGDAGNPSGSQDKNQISGKILRLNLDGSIPDDNPYKGNYVFSVGHRNAQGLVLANDNIYSSEHGPNNDDEVNLIEKGNNYGWPNVEGYCDKENELSFCEDHHVTEPLISWSPTIAPAGLAYYDHINIPEWKNSLLLTTLKGRSFRVLKLNENGTKILKERIYFQKVLGRIRDVCVSPEGNIYLITSNTDWHPKSQVWMYDNLPSDGYDKIIKLSLMKSKDDDTYVSIPILKEDSAQMSLFSENWEITINSKEEGVRLYLQNCASCHMPDGRGIENLIPPLVHSDWVTNDKKRLIRLTLTGLSEEIEVDGRMYNQEMPGFSSLNDSEIASILNFIRRKFGNEEKSILPNEIYEIRRKL